MKKVLLFAFAFISICATAQVYPHVDGFETYTDLAQLGTQGGYSSDMSVYSSHGINTSKCSSAWMSNSNTEDSLVSPLIGPLTAQSVFSFQYRIVESVNYPNVAATPGNGDKIEVLGRTDQSPAYYPIMTIDASNHIASNGFKKVSFSLQAGAGANAYFKLKVTRGSAGDYYVDVDSFAVNDEIGGLIIKPTVSNPVCNGAATGSISLLIEGGVAPYTYGWSNILISTPTQSNLAAGTYSVTVWDNSGRSATRSMTLTQPEAIHLSTVATNALCNGADNGTINLTVLNGVAPYTFVWSSMTQTEDLSGLVAGTYDVVVSDVFNCTATATQVVLEPEMISVTETHTNVSGPGYNDATINIAATGGSLNYQCSINQSSYSSSEVFTDLPAGCYTVRVKDSNNCFYDTQPICVSELVSAISELNNDNVSVYPNPASRYVNVGIQLVNSGDIFIANSLGVIVATKTIVSNETRIDVSSLAIGKYVVGIKTDRGTYKKKITIIR